MRSRAARITIGALAAIAIGAAAAFLISTEKQIAEQMTSLRAFDLHAREATDALADLRTGQPAYVAAGQGATFWMPKVTATSDALTTAVAELRRTAVSADARMSLEQAARSIAEFGEIDKRVRDYLKSSQQLMAADVIFTEGIEMVATAAGQIERARLAERQAADASQAQMRKNQAIALATAAAVAVLALLILALPKPAAAERVAANESEPSADGIDLTRPEPRPTPPSMMKAAADLATDVGRARDYSDLARLLERVAELIDASGIVVWVGSLTGADLKPVLAHGYTPQVVARMPTVPKSSNNAAAAAYRTGALQIVLSRPGGSTGAIVAPILTADGCIGAVSAEIRSGGETAEAVQAVAAIFAAQLANIIAAPVVDAAVSDSKTASA
jgi:hypothetical protein